MARDDDSALPRVHVRGVDRTFSMLPTASFTVTNAMLVSGCVREFARHAPAALAQTFNKHPRMRAKMSRTEFATAVIHPSLTRQDIDDLRLFRVQEVSKEQLADDAKWHAYVQKQCEVAFDRYSEFAFALHAWVSPESDQARLFLFSDHYITDGGSGNTILHDVLAFASALSLAESPEEAAERAVSEQTPLPLLPPLYDLVLAARPILSRVLRVLFNITGRTILKSSLASDSLIPIRSDQRDFAIPPPNNSSTLLFATGTKENLDKVLARCREEGTTFFGAVTAAVVTGYVAMVRSNEAKMAQKMKVFGTANFRSRLVEPIAADTVGQYVTAANLDVLSSEPMRALASKSFWELARTAKQDISDMVGDFTKVAAGQVINDQFFTDAIAPATFEGVSMPFSCAGDTNISSVGRYPYALRHSFRTSGGTVSELRVESLHLNVTAPFAMPATQFTIASVHAVGYGVVHHYEEHAGAELFSTVVDVMENSWRIDSSESVLAVVQHRVASPGIETSESKQN